MAKIYCVKKDGAWTDSTKSEYDKKKALGRPVKIADSGKHCDGTSLTARPNPQPTDCTAQDNEKLNAGYKKADVATFRSAKSKPNEYEVTYFYCKSDNKNHLLINLEILFINTILQLLVSIIYGYQMTQD